MDYKSFLIALGFSPKENSAGIFSKKYRQADEYCLEIDFDKQTIDYGEKIQSDSKTTLNFSQSENFVVLECVNRLLEKGYKPEHIILEKTWGAGHGASGRLDVCVTRDDGSEYLLIECKTHGKEFDKEFSRMKKDGGQLFTYFKFSNKADVIMLYASYLKGKEIAYRNEIVKIEDDYRTGDVKDFYEKWNKLTKDNGVFDIWTKPYNFQSKAITKEQLKEIGYADSSFIFNRFLEILRHNVVSDKGNAFNKIFTLFLCKVYDETSTLDGEELQFQWREGVDNHVDFQLRLTDLYSKGMKKFLDRTVSDFNEEDFHKQCKNLHDEAKKFLLREVNKLRLEKNNEFAIKEVYDTQSFEENAKVVKEVVELIQGYKIRYNKRQQYLSDFFERLLTTGLKQEAGQFFTPVPIAQFIIKSLPLDTIVSDKLKQKDGEILPYMIDYAAGSGHFITEYMHEVQRLINQSEPEKYIDSTAKKIKNWRDDHFDWATHYVYGIEKDYRLVKVGKVGCYLHGDGLANVILSDGLANFSQCKDYRGKLKKDAKDASKENQQFDILLSNPPYSVSAFRQTTRNYYTENDFELYDNLTDNSSEIECLFVERAKQLLKDGGVAGIILPSSILSNEGIYTKAREIILQNFEIVAITELGSNTFMATGTNTVVLFLRRRNSYDSINLKESIERFFVNFQDVTLNGIEKPFSKYVSHVWDGLSWDDYLSLLKNNPSGFIQAKSELYKEYRKKLKFKTEKEFWQKFVETEKEKLLYFILAYPQKNVVLVKTGEKDAEKRFLGYEFSNRRGNEGIHPIQRGKTIDTCTKLFDEERFDNEEKASSYIYKAFSGNDEIPIHESLKNNISRVRLADMLTFDRATFAKNISTAVKKKVRVETKWNIVRIGQVVTTQYGFTDKAIDNGEVRYLRITDLNDDGSINLEKEKKYINPTEEIKQQFLLKNNDIVIARSGSVGKSAIFKKDKYDDMIFASYLIRLQIIEDKILPDYLFCFTTTQMYWNQVEINSIAVTQPNLNAEKIKEFQIPLPPKEIQEKIVTEIEALAKKEAEEKEKIGKGKKQIFSLLANFSKGNISDLCHISDEKCNPQDNPEKEYLYLGLEHIESDTGTYNDNFERGLNILSTKNVFHKNDVLYGKLRPYLNKAVIAKKEGICSTDILVLKTDVPQILKYVLLSEELVTQTTDLMKGVSLPRIKIEDFLNLKIPLPPLSEQQRIVSEIEKIEEQITELEQQISKIPKEKDAVLKKYL
ncbi:MAG: restriction endonuclease subunit S [Bacteroidales bacterium]|nr:restriction endonuclease subunit S [Bacteroidales bacterium]